jgi:hypothetical protein
LISKYRRRQDRERRLQEERSRCYEDNWWCPFFVFCWNEGSRLSSVDNCPTLKVADHGTTIVLSRGSALMTEAEGRSAEVNMEKDVSPYVMGWGAGLKPKISWKMKPMIEFQMKGL